MSPSLETQALVALQQGIPLVPRPFDELAADLGCGEADLLDYVKRLRAQGLVRRLGAVFDTRRLGYSSVLCAAEVPPGEVDGAAARVTPLRGVTHCYVREAVPAGETHYPNLWFTLSYPADVFAAMADEVRARLNPYPVHILPAMRRYKVDVVFGAATRARDESVEDDGTPLTAADRVLIAALQGDTEERPDYFAALARQTGQKEWDILARLEVWRRIGRLKRIGLLLAHREAGWTANGMCCWKVAGDTTSAGRALAACATVTHCYERPEAPAFPYNLFAMIHARSLEAAREQFAALETSCGLSNGVVLISTREYKKTSMTFFATP